METAGSGDAKVEIKLEMDTQVCEVNQSESEAISDVKIEFEFDKDAVYDVNGAISDEIISDVTDEAIPEVTDEVIPDANNVTSEVILEVSEGNPEVISEVNSEVIEVIPEFNEDTSVELPDSAPAIDSSNEPQDLTKRATKDCKVIPLELLKSPWTDTTHLIEIAVNNETGDKYYQIVLDQPTTTTEDNASEATTPCPQPPTVSPDDPSSSSHTAILKKSGIARVVHRTKREAATLREFPTNCPMWATRLHDCEEIGNSYRGYVENESEMERLLTIHRQQTGTIWGTRQSPSSSREAKRLMWKSSYVPFDGMPFLNLGSRAIVMECQFGPRRKGGPHKRSRNTKGDNIPCTCPARIYVKKVKKFPEFQVDISAEVDKVVLKKNMDNVFQVIKEIGIDKIAGFERYYIQLPTNKAHQYHMTPDYAICEEPAADEVSPVESRLHPELCEKVREMVCHGEINAYVIRQLLRAHVTVTMFAGTKLPERHNLYYFPTIIDIKNQVLLAIAAIESGELEQVIPITITDPRAITEPPPSSITPTSMHLYDNQMWESMDEIGPASSGEKMWPAEMTTTTTTTTTTKITAATTRTTTATAAVTTTTMSAKTAAAKPPQTHSVTVTLTQSPEEGESFISQVETHLSDGTSFISDSLTPETARLLSQINQQCQEHVQAPTEGSLALQEMVSEAADEMSQSERLLPNEKTDLSQSGDAVVTQKDDPTLMQSGALLGLSDGSNQSETLLETPEDISSHSLLESAATDLDRSEHLLHGDLDHVAGIEVSKHLLDSGTSSSYTSGDELESAEAVQARELLIRTAADLKKLEEEISPRSRKRQRMDVG